MIRVPEEMAAALASAFLADMARAPMLEKHVRDRHVDGRVLSSMILADLDRMVRGTRTIPLFPNIRAFMKTQMNVEEAKLKAGVSEWAEIASAIVGAAGSYVAAKTTAKAQIDITKLQAEQQALAIKAAENEAAKQRLALAQSQGVPGAAAGVEDGLPSWVIPVGVAAVGVGTIAYVATRGGSKPKRRGARRSRRR